MLYLVSDLYIWLLVDQLWVKFTSSNKLWSRMCVNLLHFPFTSTWDHEEPLDSHERLWVCFNRLKLLSCKYHHLQAAFDAKSEKVRQFFFWCCCCMLYFTFSIPLLLCIKIIYLKKKVINLWLLHTSKMCCKSVHNLELGSNHFSHGFDFLGIWETVGWSLQGLMSSFWSPGTSSPAWIMRNTSGKERDGGSAIASAASASLSRAASTSVCCSIATALFKTIQSNS